MLEDKMLLWKMKDGSSEALCRIYEKYKSDLFALANALLHDLNAAEDVVHDVFDSCWKAHNINSTACCTSRIRPDGPA
jgi:DNA-directed RNA polymerase specialized sigma24 family protein